MESPNPPAPSGRPTLKLDRDVALLEAWRGGESTVAIGRRFGITNVRVGQILAGYGIDAMSEHKRRLAEHRAARDAQHKAQAEARKRERLAANRAKAEVKYAQWRVMWDEGLTIDAIAKALGKPRPTVLDRIRCLRETYGWFPLRIRSWKTRHAGSRTYRRRTENETANPA